MSLAYLASDLEVETGILNTAARQDALGLEAAGAVIENLKIQDQEITVRTLAQHLKLTIGLDPLQAKRAASRLIKNKFTVPILSAEISETYDDYVRMKTSGNGVDKLAEVAAKDISEMQAAMFLTATALATGDNEGICSTGNFREPSTDLIANDYAIGASSLNSMISDLIDGNGTTSTLGMHDKSIGKTLVLFLNPDVYRTANETRDSISGSTLLAEWRRLLESERPGSRIISSSLLANTIAEGADGTLTITRTSSNAALVLQSPEVTTVHQSPFEQRLNVLTKNEGYYNKIVKRNLTLVHNADGIIFEDGVTI